MISSETMTIREDKAKLYESVYVQMEGLLSRNDNRISNMANFAALLKSNFDFFWVGFYIIESNELVLGPFQGPVACTRISKGKGVCGTAWSDQRSIVVADVHDFPGHIACNAASKSEIVIPLIYDGVVIGVLDIDSNELDCFDEVDKQWLEKLCECLLSVI
ncbi:MAG: GAF domain-containing protein [Crocinitomicaceae bacterium]|nr:GAF domain-containing protein [Crocinitomicaceae bacterium]MDC1245181.1 GAF domain-containing protein [Crocinitomicaceae bacterium]MDO7613495.1 GAF domain-containing protein [Crocinitomicaceae bacterium]